MAKHDGERFFDLDDMFQDEPDASPQFMHVPPPPEPELTPAEELFGADETDEDELPDLEPVVRESDEPEVCATLTARHRRVCRLYVRGLRKFKIAEICGYHPNRVGIILKKPESIAYCKYLFTRLDLITEDVERIIQLTAVKAVNRLVDIIDNPRAKTSDVMKASWDFLDRAGFKPPDRVQVNVNNSAIGAEDIERLGVIDKIVGKSTDGDAK